jgi:hypothetical protein
VGWWLEGLQGPGGGSPTERCWRAGAVGWRCALPACQSMQMHPAIRSHSTYLAAEAPGAPDAVEVVLGVVREVIVDDQGHLRAGKFRAGF